jgi:hypothetical protein
MCVNCVNHLKNCRFFVSQNDIRITFLYNNKVDAAANHFKQREVEADDPVMYQL